MITAAILTGAFAAWLVTARALYARWRGLTRGKRDCNTHGSTRYRVHRCCYDQTRSADGEAAALAVLAALAFPLVLLVALVRFRPPPTAMERAEAQARLEERNEKLQARNAELERELGIGDKS